MGLYDFTLNMKQSVEKDAVGSLMIALVALSAEFFPKYIYMMVMLLSGYIVFNKFVGLKEKKIDVHLAAESLKADVVRKEENLRGEIIITKLRILDDKSRVLAHTSINNNLTEEEQKAMYDKYDIFCEEVDTIMTKDIKAPYHEFMLNEDNTGEAPLPTVEAVNKKFADINVLQEK
jgi:hypothetical protein